MTDREKLIALTMCHCSIITSGACPKTSNGKCTILDCASCLADHLISNGVVVREWIPVEERFPDLELVEAMSNDTDFYPCLAVIKHERLMGRRYISKLWYDKNGFIDGDCIDRTSNVTHWMPLPEPPKEET